MVGHTIVIDGFASFAPASGPPAKRNGKKSSQSLAPIICPRAVRRQLWWASGVL